MLNFDGPVPKDKILIPDSLDELKYFRGDLYGYIREDSGVCVVIGWGCYEGFKIALVEGNDFTPDERYAPNIPDESLKATVIGNIGIKVPDYGVYGLLSDNGMVSYHLIGAKSDRLRTLGGSWLKKEVYSLKQDLFSRNTGLLETSAMSDKSVLIVGCGSVGSTLALQLARSGVGRFMLVDTDTVEIHNICRHQCNLTDVGRYKTEALRDRIKGINPLAQIWIANKIIQNLTTGELEDFLGDMPCTDLVTGRDLNRPRQSVIVGCGDNRLSDAFSCELAYERGIPFISIGFWIRASVCEIGTFIPQKGHTCYRCAMETAIENNMRNMNQNHFYVGEEDLAKTAFEPGISIDIEFGTSVASKVVLDALNLDNPNYISKVLHTLTQYTLICNTNAVEIGGEEVRIFSYPLQVVRNIHFEEGVCAYCKQLESD